MTISRTIVCGGVKPAKLDLDSDSVLPLTIWKGQTQNIPLFFEDIHATLQRNVHPLFVDLIEIAAYVCVADQSIHRGQFEAETFGQNWRRNLRFHIPVRVPEFWGDSETSAILRETVGFLSDDHYDFQFYPAKDPPGIQRYLPLEEANPKLAEPEQVILFSGGLDSLGGAVEEIIAKKRQVILVNHKTTDKFSKRHTALVELLSRKAGVQAPGHLRVRANKDSELTKENTQRARSLLYGAMGATVAQMVGLKSFRFYENGVVALNLPVCAQVVGGRATRTAHPRVLRGLQRLLERMVGGKFEVDNPFVDSTRADVIKKIIERDCGELIRHSTSCSHTRMASNETPHCGVCSQCIDRRFGIIAAEAEELDPAEGYRVNIFTESMPKEIDKIMMATYLQRSREVQGISNQIEFIANFPEVLEAIPYVEGKPHNACGRFFDLYRRHGGEVKSAIKTVLARHLEEIQDGTLPTDCLLRIAYEAGSLNAVPSPHLEGGGATAEKPDGSVESVWVNESYAFDLNGKSVRTFGGRFWVGESVTPRDLSRPCAGRVRLVLQEHALEFNVRGKEVLKVSRIVRVVTDGSASCVEFEGGGVRKIDAVAYPDLCDDEKSVVRGAVLAKGMAGDAIFGSLPTASLCNGWKSIRLPSGQTVDLGGRRSSRGLILEAVWNYCTEKRTLQFPFETVLAEYNKGLAPGSQRIGGRFDHDVFRGQKEEFGEMFTGIGAAKDQVFRLLVRFVTAS